MHLFVPFDGSALARVALMEACRMATPLDRVTAMVAVLVPRHFAVDIEAGYIWRETNQADRLVKESRRFADQLGHYGSEMRAVQVQARTHADAILAGAAHYRADSILFAVSAGPRGRLASLFGTVPTVIRHAPCDVRVIFVARPRFRDRAGSMRPHVDRVPVPDGAPDHRDTTESLNTEGVGKSDV